MLTLIAQANDTVNRLRELDQLNQSGMVNVPIGDQLTIYAPTVSFDLGLTIGRASQLALMVAGIACFAFIVGGGVMWVLSGGEKGKMENARHMITAAVIGLGVTASAYAIFLVVQYFFGLNIVATG